ncbi:MAG TPA: MFS transporter [candidate division Zixibacteria bacterium]|nr:MFS transporter [candidate division Zixibacteria bacterium]
MLPRNLGNLRQYDRNLWILAAGWFISASGFAVSLPFIAIYFHSKYGMSPTDIGIFYGVMAVVRSAFQGIGGELSDRFSRQGLMIHTQVYRGISFFLMACAIYWDWGFWWLAVFLFIMSAFGAIFQPTANAMVSDILPQEQRLDGYAITRAAGNLGWAAGPAVGGFMASSSYSMLFVISAVVTFVSAAIFLFFLKAPDNRLPSDRFHIRDVIAVKDDKLLARHSLLIFLLYLVVAQLIVPFSLYSVEMVGIEENQLGYLYTLNGLMVVALQLPMTRLLSRFSLSVQLAYGAFLYAVGYGMIGVLVGFEYFMFAIIIVTFGEIVMSPPSLTLTSRLAPEGRMGRYMGIYGFFVASGWSFGPLFGGYILDHFGQSPALAWALISSLALVSGIGYLLSRHKFVSLDRVEPETTPISE